jgi:hypothetical protein
VRTVLGVLAAAVVGVVLAVTAAYAIVAGNGPDQKAQDLLRNGHGSEQSVVQYGQR